MFSHFRPLLSGFLIFISSATYADISASVAFTAGETKIAGRLAQIGDKVSEGAALLTGGDGYLYLKTLDNGFFILRPNSAGQIISYRIDAQNPTNNHFKLELQYGVARHISGDAVKNTRQNFRFNTPVAAIGVRGTDFTVFANQQTTRVAVLSGGVVVSPLTGDCVSGGLGPCDGTLSRELFADKNVQALQVNRGQAPVLIYGAEQSPDSVAPPRTNEPSSKPASQSSKDNHNPGVAVEINLDPIKANSIGQLTIPTEPPQLIWGRWQAVLDKTIEVDVSSLQATNQLIATNAHFALMRSRETSWQKPTQTALAFSIQDSQALIQDQASNKLTPAKIENGLLRIDFAQSSFFTKFDLVNRSERFSLQNQGEVSPDGRLYGGSQFLRPNNMDVRGALANDNKTAAYLFQSRLDEQRVATGSISWGK